MKTRDEYEDDLESIMDLEDIEIEDDTIDIGSIFINAVNDLYDLIDEIFSGKSESND